MKAVMRRVQLVSILLLSSPLVLEARSIGLDDLAHLTRVQSPRISPDGSTVVVVVSRPDYEENVYASELLLIDLESGDQRALTHARPRVSHPRWSPAGDTLAFLAAADTADGGGEESEKPQIFVLPMRGGEARAVTSAPQGVRAFEWVGDGDSLLYVAADEEDEEPDGPERHNKSFVVGHNDYLAQGAPPQAHLWVVSIAPSTAPDAAEARRLEVPGVAVAGGLLASLAVSPDGKAAAFTGYPKDRYGDNLAVALYVVDLDDASRRPFGETLDLVFSGAFSLDGGRLAYSRSTSGRPFFTSHTILVAAASGGEGREVTGSIDRTFYGARWMPAGDAILVGAPDGAGNSLWLQPIEGAPRRIDIGDLQPSAGLGTPDLDIGPKGALAFVASQADRPAELFYMPSIGGEPRRLTDLNAEIAALDLGRVEEVTWQGPDGFSENGMLIYPPDFDPSKRYPLVLRIHGGPMGSSTAAFDTLGQLLAARGWVVFEPNYRGSANLGASYQASIVGDAGEGPGRDVMAGVAKVKDRGFVDPERMAVSGWSYGGYMTSWLIGNYPEVWAAAVAGAPVTDYTDQYALSDFNTGFLWGFLERPWSKAGQAAWRRQSPVSYLHRARAPTLILCDTGDRRVPITESYKLYHALDDHGVPVEFVAYPVPGHFPGDPVHTRDVFRRWGDWIERWFEEAGR